MWEDKTEYLETHFQVVERLLLDVDKRGSNVEKVQLKGGRGALWELAQEITDAFCRAYTDYDWVEGEWWDEVDNFTQDYINKL